MTPKEIADSFIYDAKSQGYNDEIALDMAKFAVDKIINYTEAQTHEYYSWLDVLDELESR